MKSGFFHKQKKDNRRGVTLVEVMLSAAILGILAVVLVNALFYPTRLVVSDARRQIALSEANAEMETVRSTDYAAISSGTTNRTIVALNQTQTVSRTVVLTTNAVYFYGIKKITVTVTESGKTNVVLVTQRTL